MDGDILSLKKEQRKRALKRRALLPEYTRAEYSQSICRKLIELDCIADAKIIMSYNAVGSEVDVDFFNSMMLQQGKLVAYPRCKDDGIMSALLPQDAFSAELGKYGIPAPVPEKSSEAEPESIDVVVVPLVAFDSEGHRLGRGKGYYDRFLLRCTKAVFIGVAFGVQQEDAVICEPHDMRLDLVVSE